MGSGSEPVPREASPVVASAPAVRAASMVLCRWVRVWVWQMVLMLLVVARRKGLRDQPLRMLHLLMKLLSVCDG